VSHNGGRLARAVDPEARIVFCVSRSVKGAIVDGEQDSSNICKWRRVASVVAASGVAQLRDLAASLGRPARQRTTTYREVGAERLAAAESFDRSLQRQLQLVTVNAQEAP
jgi:hypothetical protein